VGAYKWAPLQCGVAPVKPGLNSFKRSKLDSNLLQTTSELIQFKKDVPELKNLK
jgi:hypothetical protein